MIKSKSLLSYAGLFSTNSVVFIDSSIADYRSLIDSLQPGSEYYLLDTGSDGLQQMLSQLAGRTELDAIHIFSHGSSGNLYLGTTQLNNANLTSYQTQLAALGASLNSQGDLLLYGCDIAAGAAGQDFISSLANYTGTDVAASADLTGSAVLAGNWLLETSIGSVEAQPLAAENYLGLLAVGPGNSAPVLALQTGAFGLDYSENTTNILTPSATVYDAELNTIGNYAGATLTLSRSVSANASDVYSAAQELANGGKATLGALIEGGNLTVSGTVIGTVTQNSAGTLKLSFSSLADQAKVNAVLQQISYSNSSDNPPATVDLQWNFSDGNSGSQGSGGALVSSAMLRLNVIAVNDAPQLATPTAIVYTDTSADDVFNAVNGSLSGSDPDNKNLSYGIVGGVDNGDGWLYKVGSYGTLWVKTSDGQYTFEPDNDALEAAPAAGLENHTVTVSDGSLSASATFAVNVNGVNDAPSFLQGNGKLTTSFSNVSAYAYSLVVQPDGRILLAGTSSGGSKDFAIARYNIDGSLDTSFDGDGKLTTDFGGVDDGRSIALQTDGKILVAGNSINGGLSQDIALARYNADGSLDTSFDSYGKLTTDLSAMERGMCVFQQVDGKILVAGNYSVNSNPIFLLVRYTASGSLDSGFGAGGVIKTDFGGSGINEARSATLQADGKILVAGYISGVDTDFALARYHADGSLDTSFDNDGKLTTDFGGHEDANSVVVQADGKILVAGYHRPISDNVQAQLLLVRYNTDGSLDTSFDNDGMLILSNVGPGYSVTTQGDGKILVAGFNYSNFVLVRLNQDGSLDTRFGGGDVMTDFNGYRDEANSVTVQADGKILVSGSAGTSSGGSDFALVRYNAADGRWDTRFNAVSSSLDNIAAFAEKSPTPVALDSNVAIYDADLAAIGNYGGSSITLARHGGASSQDVFSSSGNLSTLTEGNALVLSGTIIGSVSHNSAGMLTLSFNSNATQAKVNEALSSLNYLNTSNNPPASVQIDWTFSDGNTLAQGSGGALTALGSTTVNITLINDTPNAVNATLAVAKNTAYSFSLTDFGFSDAEDASLSAVRIDTLPAAGNLRFDGANLATTGLNISAAEILAGRLSFMPANGGTGNGYASFNFSVKDSGGLYDTTPNTLTFNIPQVNEIPTASNATLTTSEDVAKELTVADFGFSDADAGDSLQSVTITSLPVVGSLQLNGQSVTLNQVVSTSDIAAGQLQFTAIANAFASPYASFGFKVSDGKAESAASYTLTFNVTAANDLPTGANSSLNTQEDTAITLSTSDFGFSDVDAGDSLQSVTITSLPTAGSLTLNGVAVTRNHVIAVAQLAAGQLVFTPAANAFAASYASIGFKVSDGTAVSASDYELTIDVTATNDSPFLLHALPDQSAKIDSLFNLHIPTDTFGDIDGGIASTLTYSATLKDDTPLPAWLTFDTTNAVFTGTPTANDVGGFDVKLVATDDGRANAIDIIHFSVFSQQSTGSDRNDRLVGTPGNDLLDGGLGKDTMSGMAGDDTYRVNNTGDRIIESKNGGTDTAEASISYTLAANVEILRLTGDDNLNGTGNNTSNTLYGNNGKNLLNGSGGIDQFAGNNGDDTYIINDLAEQVMEQDDEGFDSILLRVNRPGDFSIEDMGETENVTITGSGLINLIGNLFDNLLIGNNKANRIDGGDGDDILNGRLGKDILTGGLGSDTFVFNTAASKSNLDTITDFVSAEDLIRFDHLIYTKLIPGELEDICFAAGDGMIKALNPDIRLFQDTISGILYYDADGSGKKPSVPVTIVGSNPLDYTDFQII